MAENKDQNGRNRERLYVNVEQTERKVIPSVQLERREIKMTFSPLEQSVSSVATVTDQQQDIERIVGKEYSVTLAADNSSASPKVIEGHVPESVPEVSKERSRSSQKQDGQHANVLEFFEEQGKSFQEHSKSLVPKPRKDRSISPSHMRQSVGLDHLDNLVKLMEQLSQLKDENLKLKKKCDYLESTKTLLQAKSAVETEITIPSGYHSLPSKSKVWKSPKERRKMPRPRLPSAEDIEILESCESLESSSDTSPKRPKHTQIHKRSFSTGSLEIPSDIMEQSGEDDSQERLFHQNGKIKSKISKSPATKRKSKISNWSRIKKVLSRQRLPEDIGFSFKSLSRFGGNVRLSSGSTKELSVPATTVENRSVDSGNGSGVETDAGEGPRKPTGEVNISQQGGSASSSPPMGNKLNYADLASEIWMGPPEWLEEHEEEMKLADPESCIENKEVIVLKSAAEKLENNENLLQVPIPRRKSSPSLLEHDVRKEMEEQDLADMEEYLNLRRASSYKGRSSTGELISVPVEPKTVKKLHRSKLSKMKYMVRTSKDSVKRKLSKRSLGHHEMEDYHEGYDFDDDHEGPLGRSTPKTSPLTMRQKSLEHKIPPTWISQMGASIDVTSLMGGMSDEFSKKMQQWEEKKTKKPQLTVMKDSSDASDGVFSSDSFGPVSPEFQKKMDDWERTKSIKSTSSQKMYYDDKSEEFLRGSRDGSPDGTASPLETSVQSINVEDMQKKLTDSFSRKMEEWERRKYRKERSSPTLDRKDSTGKPIKKEDRLKSRKSKVEKDREKLDKMRGREMRRVEIEQQKLEKEKIRIEKERLKALEREARLEKMKGRLSQPDMEAKVKSPILAPLAEYKVTTDFAKKLHEWEIRKGISSGSMATYYESKLRQLDQTPQSDYHTHKDSDDDTPVYSHKVKGQKPPPLTLQPYFDSPEERSPGGRSSDGSFDDATSITMESMTENNIKSLQIANASLVEELHAKEMEYETLQEEVKDLSEKVNSARIQHSKELEQYKKELITGGTSAQVPKLTQEMGSKLSELESKIRELQSFGDNLAQKMESAALCKWQSIEGEESVTSRLVELLEKMRLMLYKASHTEELTQKSTALYTFEKIYSQAMQLQVQLTNLRLSQLERNKEIVTMKRQLLVQEANNLLLQADIARRETELNWHKQHARKGMLIKRWNTYGGMEGRVVEGQETECVPPYKRFAKGRKDPTQPVVESGDITETLEPEDEVKEDSLEQKAVEPPESPIEIQHKSCIYLPMRKQTEQKRTQFHREVSMEIPFVDQEQEDAVRILPDNVKDGHVIRGEKGVEISLTIKLPTANINLPRDISQQELNVPRSLRRSEENLDSVNKSEINPIVQVQKAQFSESKPLQVQRPKGKLEKIPSTEVSDVELQIQSAQDNSSKEDDKFKRESDISVGSDNVFVESPPRDHKTIIIPVRVTKLSNSDTSSNQIPTQESHRETITLSPKLLHKSLQRKPPTSPIYTAPVSDKTFNWPKVRHVSYVGHRIKPADELLEESKRYRKGQSVYMSRILQKYKTDESRKYLMERQKSHDKENIAEGYVQSIVKRLSREGTPDITGDSTPKHIVSYRPDSPQGRSEFVQQIVKKLSSPVDQSRSQSSPLRDVTNGIPKKVKKLTEVFDSGSTRNTPERALSDSESHYTTHKSHKTTSKEQSVTYESSSSTSTLTSVTGVSEVIYQMEASAMNYSSLPLLTVKEEDSTDLQKTYRERAATTTTCDSAADQGVKGQGQVEKQEIHVTLSPWQQIKSASQECFHPHHHESHSSQSSGSKLSEVKLHIGQKPSKVKKETIGALCQQTMLSFDLGLSLQASEQIQYRKDSEADSGYSGKSPRPLSSGSEGEPSSSTEEKRKSKSKFFETHWFHKPKKFFKVSKC